MEVVRLGIVILNYNTWKETIKCVKTIQKYTKLPYKIFIVDNKSPNNSLKELEKYYDEKSSIVLLDSGKNRGYSAGNNIGIKRAINDGCDVIFIVNSDIELLNDAFGLMTGTLLKNEKYMMVGPSVLDNNQKETQIPRKKLTFKYFFFERHPFCNIHFCKKIAERNYPVPEKGILVFEGSVSGCCFCIRSKDFVDINYFDENVFLYYEEDILAYKMWVRKKKAVVDSCAKVWHKANVSTKKEGMPFIRFHAWTSVLYMLKTYAKINWICQIFIVFRNILIWLMLSVVSKSYRNMFKDFWAENWKIILEKTEDVY